MKSQRITKGIALELTHLLLQHRFQEEGKRLKKEEAELALQVYIEVFSANDVALMRKCPPGWFYTGRTIRVSFGAVFTHLDLEEAKPFPYKNISAALCTYPVEDAKTKAYDALRSKQEALSHKRRGVRQQLLATLCSITTTKKLLEKWPEVKPFVEQVLVFKTDEPAPVPAIPLQKLNKALGLK